MTGAEFLSSGDIYAPADPGSAYAGVSAARHEEIARVLFFPTDGIVCPTIAARLGRLFLQTAFGKQATR
jgi:hypothetical protein